MQGAVFHRRILRLLSDERAIRGHGAASNIDRKLGKSEGYFSRLLRGDIGFRLEMLGQVLEALEIDPADFFARAVGTRIAPLSLVRRLERQLSDFSFTGPPVILPEVREQVETLLQSTRDRGLVEQPSGLTSDRESLLTPLDTLCFSDPGAAVPQVRSWLIRQLEGTSADPSRLKASRLHAVARCLGVAGSVERLEARFCSAARSLRVALELTHHQPQGALWAELLQRAAYLVADQGEARLALDLVRQAGEIHIAHHSRSGLGRSQIQKAVLLSHLGRLHEARAAHRSGLDYIPVGAWIWRFSAYQGLGFIALELDELGAAVRWIRRAAGEHRTRRGPNWWRLRWLEGEVARRQGHLAQAESALQAARAGFAERSNPFDLALVGIDLARVLLERRRPREVQRLAAEMMGLLQPLRRHRLATAALHEFARASLEGEISATLLERVARALGECAPTRLAARGTTRRRQAPCPSASTVDSS